MDIRLKRSVLSAYVYRGNYIAVNFGAISFIL